MRKTQRSWQRRSTGGGERRKKNATIKPLPFRSVASEPPRIAWSRIKTRAECRSASAVRRGASAAETLRVWRESPSYLWGRLEMWRAETLTGRLLTQRRSTPLWLSGETSGGVCLLQVWNAPGAADGDDVQLQERPFFYAAAGDFSRFSCWLHHSVCAGIITRNSPERFTLVLSLQSTVKKINLLISSTSTNLTHAY